MALLFGFMLTKWADLAVKLPNLPFQTKPLSPNQLGSVIPIYHINASHVLQSILFAIIAVSLGGFTSRDNNYYVIFA